MNSLFKIFLVSQCIFLNVIFFSLPVSAEVDNVGHGILHTRSQSPVQSLRMTVPLVAAGSVKPGWGTFAAVTWSNVWADETEYYLDYEMLDTRMTVAYGFNEKFGIALGYDNRNYFGGEMDSFIQNFHDAFGIDQSGRDEVAKGLSRIGRIGLTVEESEADILNNSGVSLLLSYDVTGGDETWPAVNISTSIRYGVETGEIYQDDHPVDYGVSVGLAKRWSEKWYSHAILSYAIYEFDQGRNLPGFSPIILEDRQYAALLSLGYDYSRRLTILAQYLLYEAAVKEIAGLDEPSHEVHLGFKYRTDKAGIVEFGLIENVITMDNSPDFGVHLGWGYHF